jgi:hypothetical protein
MPVVGIEVVIEAGATVLGGFVEVGIGVGAATIATLTSATPTVIAIPMTTRCSAPDVGTDCSPGSGLTPQCPAWFEMSSAPASFLLVTKRGASRGWSPRVWRGPGQRIGRLGVGRSSGVEGLGSGGGVTGRLGGGVPAGSAAPVSAAAPGRLEGAGLARYAIPRTSPVASRSLR